LFTFVSTQNLKQKKLIFVLVHRETANVTRVNQKVKAIFKLRGNREKEELPHCALLTMPVEQFNHSQ